MSLLELKSCCVTPFGENERRNHLFAKFEIFFHEFLISGIMGEIWINGSFLTEKMIPNDIDATVIIPAEEIGCELTLDQRNLVVATNEEKFGPDVDGFAWQWLSRSHTNYFDESLNPARTWHEQYGVENSREWLKGFAVVGLR